MRYNIPWRIKSEITLIFICSVNWKTNRRLVDADYEMKFVGKRTKSSGVKASFRFDAGQNFVWFMTDWNQYKRYVINKKLKVEFRVKINKNEGLDHSIASQDNSAVLVVGKKQFKVDKKLLADNCTYFNTLFFKSSDDWGKSEIEVEDFLELSAKFGSNSMLTKCDEFLMEKSEKSMKLKFNLAIEHKLNKLKKKCMSDIKTKKDLEGHFY
ncbi:Protein CBG17453 [Caenorhabditis briggsae]|uniref:Protein CBG17453 n=1 Tax=Caenorhabditis briggsae TaxID=6238 RepID=A8XR59_CAEBR|nr:Protein CBG17453 [Caenorhabditis briggsae]CAP35132.2 Protein CBG17453 [Caenorhabditis briggsae]